MTLKMSDIARMANVSRSAVSLALNGKPGVSKETRKKIFKIIDKKGYKPLRKRKKGGTRRVANINLIIVVDKKGIVSRSYRSLPFFDHLVSSLAKNVNGFGGHVQIDTLRIDNLTNDLHELLNTMTVTNAIILGTDLSAKNAELINQQIEHVVFLDTYYDNVNADFVTMNNFQGTYAAANYIINKGYKDIGYAALDKVAPNFLARKRGFRQALIEHKLHVTLEHFYFIEPNQLIPTVPLDNFSTDNLPEVIFCENDYTALRLMKELINQGFKIPDDIAIMGFDDIYEGILVTPELTTVHVSIEQIVNQAIMQLQEQVSTSDWEPQKCLISTRIVKRESL